MDADDAESIVDAYGPDAYAEVMDDAADEVVSDTRERLTSLPGWLTGRHIELLLYVYNWECVARSHLKALFFDDKSDKTLQRALKPLLEERYLDEVPMACLSASDRRFIEARLDKASVSYAIGANGIQVLKWAGFVPNGARYTPREHAKYLGRAIHDLQSAEFLVQLRRAALDRDDVISLDECRGPRRMRQELVQSGAGETFLPDVVPDAFIVYQGQERTTGLFVEIDRGTERGKHFIDKINGYTRWAQRPAHWKAFDANYGTNGRLMPKFPPVLVITSGERRLGNLWGQVYTSLQGNVSWYFTTWERIRDYGILHPIWAQVSRRRSGRIYSILEME
jgi:hypothetical protein